MNGGQREKSLPLVGVAGMFPEYNRRAGRLFSLGDRITDCFLRSENATGGTLHPDELPTPTSSEVLAISAYLTWLSRGAEDGQKPRRGAARTRSPRRASFPSRSSMRARAKRSTRTGA